MRMHRTSASARPESKAVGRGSALGAGGAGRGTSIYPTPSQHPTLCGWLTTNKQDEATKLMHRKRFVLVCYASGGYPLDSRSFYITNHFFVNSATRV